MATDMIVGPDDTPCASVYQEQHRGAAIGDASEQPVLGPNCIGPVAS